MKNRLGGLARRATYIRQIKEQHIPLVHLDAGDAFQAKYDVMEIDRKQVEAAVDVYLTVFEAMGLQGYNIGDRDLALGLTQLKALEKKAKFPILSANVVGTDGKPIFKPSIMLTAAGKKIGVIGVVTTLFVNKAKWTKEQGYDVTDPIAAVRRELPLLKKQGAEIIMVLAHLNETEIDELAEAAPDVNFILGGQTNRPQHLVQRINKSFVFTAYIKGKNMSVLDLHVNEAGSLVFADKDARGALERRRQQLESQVTARSRSLEAAQKDEKRKASVTYLERNLVQLKTELQGVVMELEDLPETDANSSYVRWQQLGMTPVFEDDSATKALIDAYRKNHPDPTKKARPPIPQPAVKAPPGNGPVAPIGRPRIPIPARGAQQLRTTPLPSKNALGPVR